MGIQWQGAVFAGPVVWSCSLAPCSGGFVNTDFGSDVTITGVFANTAQLSNSPFTSPGQVLTVSGNATLTADSNSVPPVSNQIITNPITYINGNDTLAYLHPTPTSWPTVPAFTNKALDYLAARTSAIETNGLAVPSVDIYVDSNRVDTYTANGTINKPYKTFSAAVAAITQASTLHLASGTYTEAANVNLPNFNIVVYGNNSTLNAAGHTITITNPNYTRYDMNTVGDVVFNSSAAGRVLVQGGSITGNIIANGLIDFKSITLSGGTVTCNANCQMLAIVSTISSQITGSGILLLEDNNFNATKASPLITSSAGGTLIAANNLVTNLGAGGAISCSNGADGVTRSNSISNNIITVASGAPVAAGTAITFYSKNIINGTNTGTGYVPINSDIIGPSSVAVGSDATGDTYYRGATTSLTRLGIGAAGTVLTSSGTVPVWGTPSVSSSGLETIWAESFEINAPTSWSSGNNATILGGGVLAGTIVNNATTPIDGLRDLTYTQAAGSLNDYFCNPTAITLNQKAKDGNAIGFNFWYKYNGAAGDIKVAIWDVTNSAILATGYNNNSFAYTTLVNATASSLFPVSFKPLATTASVKVCYQTMVANTGKVFELDDLQLSTNPFQIVNLANATDPVSCGLTAGSFTGFGTVTGINATCQQMGKMLYMKGYFTSSTQSNVENKIALPSGYTVDSSQPSDVMVGQLDMSGTGVSKFFTGATAGNSYLNVYYSYVSGGYAKVVTNGPWPVASTTFYFNALVPITSFTSNATNVITPASAKTQVMEVSQAQSAMSKITANGMGWNLANAYSGGTLRNTIGNTDNSSGYGNTSGQSFYAYNDGSTITSLYILEEGTLDISVAANSVTAGANSIDLYNKGILIPTVGHSGTTVTAGYPNWTIASFHVKKNDIITFINSGALNSASNLAWFSAKFTPAYATMMAALPNVVTNDGQANVKQFSFTYGTTNSSTVCSATPCSYLDQIGNYVTSVTRASGGSYTVNLNQTFTKLKCTGDYGSTTGTGWMGRGGSNLTSCSNCNSFSLTTISAAFSTGADTFGTLRCEGY